jgi:predicted ATPase
MHIEKVSFNPETYPVKNLYPFNLKVFHNTEFLKFDSNLTFFIGENGSGKSTLLKAISRRCGIHIWEEDAGRRFDHNRYEDQLHNHVDVSWANGKKPGAFFSSETYQHLTKIIDDWASSDPGLIEYFGGKSLISQSHGESFMTFFKVRYKLEGLYLMDEPETALSPRRQIEFMKMLSDLSLDGHVQFIIATHSPILMSCPQATIISFDHDMLKTIQYEDTDYYKIYKEFLLHREK